MPAVSLKRCLVAVVPPFLRPIWDRLEASPLGYRLARGAFWSLAGTAISRGLGLVASVLVARMLGKDKLGQLGMIQATVGMFGVFAGFGLGLTATKYVAELRCKDASRAGRIIALSSAVAWVSGLLMTVVLFLVAPWLARRTLGAPELSGLLQFGSVLLLLGAINGAQTGALAGFEAFKRIAHVNLWSGLATFPLMVGGVWWLGLTGAVLGLVVSQGAGCLLNVMALRREAAVAGVPLGYAGCRSEFHVLWGFSLPAVISSVLVVPVNWLCSTLLFNQPGGQGEMGYFTAANQWYNALMFLPSVLGQAVLPMMAEQLGKDDRVRSARLLGFSMKLNALAILPLVLGGCLASPLIMASYGDSFRSAWPTLVVVLLTAGSLGIQIPVGQIITAAGRMWLGSVMNLGWAVAFVGATFLLLRWGALGLATARLVAYLLHASWTLAFAIVLVRRSGEPRPAAI